MWGSGQARNIENIYPYTFPIFIFEHTSYVTCSTCLRTGRVGYQPLVGISAFLFMSSHGSNFFNWTGEFEFETLIEISGQMRLECQRCYCTYSKLLILAIKRNAKQSIGVANVKTLRKIFGFITITVFPLNFCWAYSPVMRKLKHPFRFYNLSDHRV